MDVALTVDMAARRGAGHRRTVVLGGGGIFFIAWQVAFLNELARQGLVLRDATRFVGTSAGSIVAALPPVAIFFLMQKHFIAGLTFGATKG